MTDEGLRELERTWRRTGATDDLAALLRGRQRAGQLTRERLHLAAYVGDPAARAVYEPPSEESIEAAVAPARFDGVEAEVRVAWVELLHSWEDMRDSFTPTHRLLAAAHRHELLGRLMPHTSMTAMGLTRCTEPPFGTYVFIEPRESLGEGRYAVRTCEYEDDVFGTLEDVVTTLARALELAADAFGSRARVWRGDASALFMDRLRLGAIDVPASLDQHSRGWPRSTRSPPRARCARSSAASRRSRSGRSWRS